EHSQARFLVSVDPAISGQWSSAIDAQVIPIHTQVLPTGKILFWQNEGDTRDEIRLWDPANGSLNTPALPPPEFYIICSAHSFMADGKLLVAGGHLPDTNAGSPGVLTYDPFTDTWTRLPNMNAGRWYPTLTTLASGDVLVISGMTIPPYIKNILPQVWQVNHE